LNYYTAEAKPAAQTTN